MAPRRGGSHAFGLLIRYRRGRDLPTASGRFGGIRAPAAAVRGQLALGISRRSHVIRPQESGRTPDGLPDLFL